MKTFKIKKNEHQEIKLEKPGSYTVELRGEGAEVKVVAVFQAQGKERLDLEVIIHH